MTLSMKLKWKNPDASSDINTRFQSVFGKGFITLPAATNLTGKITPSGVALTVTVDPFICVNNDGAVVINDAVSGALAVADGVLNYVVLRARYRLNNDPILQLQVLSAAAYAADPELPWLHVVGTVDLRLGGPHAAPPAASVTYELRDSLDQQGRSSWRDPVSTFGALPNPPFTTTADGNREGDVRLVLDTGSLYWWDDNLQIWNVFDEVPLQAHRQHEHVNGITGDSNPATLVPSVSGGTNMRVGPVPVGSGYTVNGRYLTAPLINTDVAAGGVGATRGLLQVSADQFGVVTGAYRVTKDVDALDIASARITNISDNHSTGTFILVFNNTGNTLSWDSGEPVAVSTSGTFRLFRPDYTQWIEVTMNGALPGAAVADSYIVNTSKKDENHFLIAYYFWDGAAILNLGTDKRYFGTTGGQDLADDFKGQQLNPPWNDLRGNMVYSGGTCTSPSGLLLRVTGPLIAYLGGIRYVVPASFTGITLPNATTRFVYCELDANLNPVLTVSATDPTTVTPPFNFAEVCSVVTGGGVVTSIVDRRDPEIIVGNATRNSRVRYTGTAAARWQEADKRLVVEDTGTSTSATIETGGFRTTQNRIRATTGAMSFEDTNTIPSGFVTLTNGSPTMTGDAFTGTQFLTQMPPGTRFRVISQQNNLPPAEDTIYTIASVTSNSIATLTSNYTGTTGSGKKLIRPQALTNSTDNNLAIAQPMNNLPSLIGTMLDTQRAQRFTLGIESGVGNAFAPTLPAGPLSMNVNLDTGSFYDTFGRRILTTGTTTVTLTGTLANQVWVIVWDPDANTGAGQFTSKLMNGTNNGIDVQDLAFAIATVDPTNTGIVKLEDIRRFSDGQYVRDTVTIGSTPGFSVANFSSLRQALLHACCYKDGTSPSTTNMSRPKRFIIVTDYSEPNHSTDGGCINMDASNDPIWTEAADRLEGITIFGKESSSGEAQPQITWGTGGQQGFFWNFFVSGTSAVRNVTFENVRFLYNGAGLNTNTNVVMFKNPNAGLHVYRCQINGNSKLTGLCKWSAFGTWNLGGWNTGQGVQSFMFEDVLCNNMTIAGVTTPLFNFWTPATGGGDTQVTAISGLMAFDRCAFLSANDYNTLFGCLGNSNMSDLAIFIDGCKFDSCTTAVFSEFRDSRKVIRNSTFTGASAAPSINSGTPTNSRGLVALQNCQFDNSINLTGAGQVLGCIATSNAVVTGSTTALIDSCAFLTSGTFTGAFRAIMNSQISLGTTGELLATSAQLYRMANVELQKANTTGSSVVLSIGDGGSARVMLENVEITFPNAYVGNDTTPIIRDNAAFTSFQMVNCRIIGTDRTAEMIFFDSGSQTISVSNCVIQTGVRDAIRIASSGAEVQVVGNLLQQQGIAQASCCVVRIAGVDRLTMGTNTVLSSNNMLFLSVLTTGRVVVNGNNWIYSGTQAVSNPFVFGSTTTGLDSLEFSGNVIDIGASTGVGPQFNIQVFGYKVTVFANNNISWRTGNNGGTIGLTINVDDGSTGCDSVVVANNAFFCGGANFLANKFAVITVLVEGGVARALDNASIVGNTFQIEANIASDVTSGGSMSITIDHARVGSIIANTSSQDVFGVYSGATATITNAAFKGVMTDNNLEGSTYTNSATHVTTANNNTF